jgi:hypothetical protein
MSVTHLEINRIRCFVKSTVETTSAMSTFRNLQKSRSIVVYGGCMNMNTRIVKRSDEYLDDVFHRMFFVSSSTSDDDE